MTRRVALLALEPPGEEPGFWTSYAVRRVWAELVREPIPDVEVRLFDIPAGRVEAATEAVLDFAPDWVGCSVYVWSFAPLLGVAGELRRRRPGTRVVLGGPSARPEMFALERYASLANVVDALVLGDGESVFRRMLELDARSPSELALLPGVVARTPDGFSSPVPAAHLELERLASPYALDLVPPSGTLVLETFRGCPQTCRFCQWGDATGGSRAFPTSVIAGDLRRIGELRPRSVQLIDAGINLNARAFRSLVEAERRERVLERIPLSFEAYPAGLSKDHLSFFERIRLGTVGVGVQTFESSVLERLGRRQHHDRIASTVRTLAELGADVWVELIFGLPGDSADGFRRTLDRVLELPCNVRVFHCLALPDALMTRAPPDADIRFDPESLRVTSCAGWTASDFEDVVAHLDSRATSRPGTLHSTWSFQRSATADSDDLTAWIAEMDAPVRAALGEIVGLPDVALGFRRGESGLVVVELERADGVTVELELTTTKGRRAWFERGGLGVSYRRGRDGSDPLADPARAELLQALRASIEKKSDLAERVARLVGELERLERWRELDDRMLRQISAGTAGAHATIRLGFRCNQDCGMCWQARDWPDPPEWLCERWLEEIAAAGIRQVVLSGGEPTLYRSLPDLVKRASALGLKTQLQTNAIALRKPALLNALTDAGLGDVFVSYHSHRPEVSDAITRAPGTHGATEAGIAACLEAGLSVELNTVVDRANVGHLAEHAVAIVERFVTPFPKNPVRHVTFSYPTRYYDRELHRASLVALDEITPGLVDAARVLLAHGVRVDATGAGCGFPACVLRDEPRLIRSSASSEMDLKDRSARVHVPVCEGCAFVAECPGVRREYAEIHGDRGVVPFASRP